MEPRKKSKSSRKSTNLPKEYLDNINQVFSKSFKKDLKGRPLIIDGRIFQDEIVLSVGFLPDPKALHQANFEASIDHDGKDIFKKLGICVDAISSMMSHYFENPDEADFPKHWKAFPFEKDTVYLQYSGRNTKLENEANKILGIATSDELYTEDSDFDEDDPFEDDEDSNDPKSH